MLAVPLTPHVMQAWKQMVDSSSGQLYYFNSATGETQWEEPAADYDPAEKTDSGPSDLFATLDTNGDGVIDRAEFEAAVSNKLDLKCSKYMLPACQMGNSGTQTSRTSADTEQSEENYAKGDAARTVGLKTEAMNGKECRCGFRSVSAAVPDAVLFL